MKIRNLLLLLTFLGASSILVCMFRSDKSSFHSILTETHKRLANLKHLKDNLKQQNQRELVTDEKYLTALGFTKQPNLLNENVKRDAPLPVLVTAVRPGQLQHAEEFVKSARRFLPDYLVLIYSLNLDPYDVQMLNKTCNFSSCTIRRFDLDFYPRHVSDFTISAHRPLIIQDALNLVGAVLWVDVTYVLSSSNLQPVMKCARQNGIASWAINKPTSALTHPRMFDYFHTQQENYFFHRMVHLSHIVIFNTAKIHYELMLQWIECTLIPECIAPIGAQRSGCRFDKRPLYRYSGCHHYDQSALNVILGVLFHYDASSYVVGELLFRPMQQYSTTPLAKDNTTNSGDMIAD